MPLLPHALRSIARLPASVRVQVLGAALWACSQEEAAEITRLLVEEARRAREPRPVLIELARVWRRASASQRREAIAVGAGEWTGIVATLVTDAEAAVRVSAAMLGAECREPGAAALIVSLLRDERTEVASAAERALAACAAAAASGGDPAYVRAVERAVASAAEGVSEHRRTLGVLGAMGELIGTARMLAAPEASLRGVMEDEGHPIQMAWRGWIKRDPASCTLGRVWVWARLRSVGPACVERLAEAATDEGAGAASARWYLASHPARRGALRAVMERTGGAPGVLLAPLLEGGGAERGGGDGSDRSDGAARHGGVMLAIASGVDGETMQRVRLAAVTDASARVRHSATRWMSAGSAARAAETGAVELLVDQCFDASGVVARAAARSLLRPMWRERVGGERLARTLGLLRRSPHAEVRELAAWSRLECESDAGAVRERVANRRVLRRDVDEAARRVRGALAAWRTDPDGVVRTLTGVVPPAALAPLADEIVARVVEWSGGEEPSPRLRASAARGLACARGAGVGAALAALVRLGEDADARVRCNAMESLAVMSRRVAEAGRELDACVARGLGDADHRVRGTAADFGLRQSGSLRSPAGETLAAMLEDPRPMHRVAGLWAAQRAGARTLPRGATAARWAESAGVLSELVDRVSELVRGDASGPVRARAARCAARLLAAMRAGLTTPARSGELARMEAAT